MAELNENVIEWFDGDDHIAVTLHQKRFVNRVKKLAKHDKNVEILEQNNDGSIFAHLPLSCLKLTLKRSAELDEKEKSELVERLRLAREAKEKQT